MFDVTPRAFSILKYARFTARQHLFARSETIGIQALLSLKSWKGQ